MTSSPFQSESSFLGGFGYAIENGVGSISRPVWLVLFTSRAERFPSMTLMTRSPHAAPPRARRGRGATG